MLGRLDRYSWNFGTACRAGLALLLTVGAASVAAQVTGVSTFDIQIPNRPGNFGISHVTSVLTLADDPAGITVEVTNADGVTCTMSASMGGATDVVVFDPASPLGTTCTGTFSGSVADSANLEPPVAGLPAGDPQRFRYTLELFPTSNLDTSSPGICPDDSGSPDQWTVSMVSPSPNSTGACLISWDRNVSGAECLAAEQEIESDSATEVASVLVGGTPSPQFCGGLRPAADVVLVLDRSGSMDNLTQGSVSRPKFSALRDAVDDFVTEWTTLRGLETSPPADQIGLVFFDTDEEVSVPLADFTTASVTVTGAVATECGGIDPPNCSGATSMGDGLEAAVDEFDFTNVHRKVALLMSNGKENRATRVAIDDPTHPTEVLLYETDPTATTPLLGAGEDLQIYAVTVGTSTAVSADINEDIARATGGYYINSEDDAELLRPFFLELLENALRFNTWEMLRLASGEVTTSQPVTLRFPVASTTSALTVNLLWDKSLGTLRARLVPPGSGEVTATGEGAARMAMGLPLDPPATAGQDWNLEVELLKPASHVASIPFNLVVQGDDHGLGSRLAVEAADYKPGDQILLTARVADAGVPLTSMGSGAADTVVATVLKPGVPIGDLLAASSASSAPPEDEDASSPANSKLANHLAENPDSLTTEELVVELVDTGSNGDQVAGDGIYSGVVEAQEPGHYNVVFGVEADSERGGRFSRQAMQSVHVRSVPSEEQTQVDATSTALDGGGTSVVLTFTPLTAFGHHMPGFGPYMPVTATGHATVIPTDALDGSYTATLTFPGDPPDDITIHWIEASVDLYGVSVDQLPPLGGGTVLVADVAVPEIPWTERIPLWLIVLVALLIIFLIYWIWRRLSA